MQMLDRSELVSHWKAKGLDFSRLFHKPAAPEGVAIAHTESQDHPIKTVLDRRLIAQSRAALDEKKPVQIVETVRNTDRSVGAMLSGEVARRYGHTGLPEDTIAITLTGTGGQSFGAWLAAGISLELIGQANDYVGKGLSGGRIVVRPPDDMAAVPEESIIIGNTVLYGAIAGEAYFRGVAGERFAVRNSGAIAVVEGAGDHCCEYMTGGVVVVLGRTGRNFAAGMSGGIAYVLDEEETFASRCNLSMVELEPVPEEDEIMERLHHHGGDLEHKGLIDIMRDMSGNDASRLYQIIASHARFTNSVRARAILDKWGDYLPKFRKVMPVEYRRALVELKAQEQAEPKLRRAAE
jgi:glutamate synthase (NADPH/NADH) large chain